MAPREKNAVESSSDHVSEPMAFISYTTFDNLTDQQAIAHFCERLSNEVRIQTGRPFHIFRDKKDIRWGENWRARIEEGLDASTFLIPILTPSYFQSPACQEEYNHFKKREEQLNRSDLILPVYYVECDDLENRELCDANPWAKDINSRQHENWRHLRWEPSDSPAVGRALEHMAKQIKQAINAINRGDFADIGAVIKTIPSEGFAAIDDDIIVAPSEELSAIYADIATSDPVVRAIDLLIKQAVRDRASDVHIEPQEDRLHVRYRIDGILHEVMSLPLSVHTPLLSRVKIMAGLNIAERRRPQDGQITFDMGDREIILRLATLNTVHGEMVVLRILDKSFAFLPLPELGFSPESLEKYSHILENPSGMILISGPTGSGMTTTLYASINHCNGTEQSIITIEDPVEYRFNNINQMQVNRSGGLTFATSLRACMRLNPDVILVGEIRDGETAEIATQASLTDHLVLSSVHANDTVSVIFRMIDLGVEPFLLSSALVGITAQRMVRRICPYCSQPIQASPDEQLAYEQEMNEKQSEFLVGAGCNFCANTGYLGRTGIFEVLVMSEAIRKMILSGASSDEIRNQAVREGMIPLRRDGMIKVKTGITTPYEVMRNTFPSFRG